jgi:hypothetical protein
MLIKLQPFRTDAHCRNQIGRLRKFISSTAFPIAMSFLWTMSRHPQLYEIAREAQRPQCKERFKLAWPVQVRDLGRLTIRRRADGIAAGVLIRTAHSRF